MDRHRQIDFETALRRGKTTYNKAVGDWWLEQCANASHRHAYRAIAGELRAFLGQGAGTREPKLIIEYACGPGHLLSRLALRFPKSSLIGIDGSSKMIEAARRRLSRMGPAVASRVEFVESRLPNFDLPQYEADALIFAFPNICPAEDEQPYYDKHGSKNKSDRAVAKLLGKAREADPADETVFDDPETMTTALLDCKVVSRNLRGLLRKGGACLRAEYANAPRKELSELVNMRLDFEAGAMSREFQGKKAEPVFKLAKESYRRSQVIEDVYHQSGNEDDRKGGYLINILRAI